MSTRMRQSMTDTRVVQSGTLKPDGSINTSTTTNYRDFSVQRTVSEGHLWPLTKSTKGLDSGGSFTSQSVYVNRGTGTINARTSTSFAKGEVVCTTPNFTPTSSSFLTPRSVAYLSALGTTAIARCLPTNPLSGLGQFLGELREIPTIPEILRWKKLTKQAVRAKRKYRYKPKSAARDYLNAQFGWIPFLSDLSKFIEVTQSHERVIKNYEDNSGKHLRRRITVHEDSASVHDTPVPNSVGAPALVTQLYTTRGVLTSVTTNTIKCWFSGAFTYYLPPVGDMLTPEGFANRSALARKLYGLSVDPEIVWKLAPWSWAIDWVTNAGDVIHNWQAFQRDGLVMHYGYIMCHETQRIHKSISGINPKGQGPLPVISDEFVYENKQRLRATPYGFGLDPGTFSAKQWSIIAALGISRKPLKLD